MNFPAAVEPVVLNAYHAVSDDIFVNVIAVSSSGARLILMPSSRSINSRAVFFVSLTVFFFAMFVLFLCRESFEREKSTSPPPAEKTFTVCYDHITARCGCRSDVNAPSVRHNVETFERPSFRFPRRELRAGGFAFHSLCRLCRSRGRFRPFLRSASE